MKKFLLLISIIFLGFTNSYATHAMSGDITYVHISGNVYQVSLTLYRDCAGTTIQPTQQTVSFTSSCGTFTQQLPWISTTNVSQLCPTQINNSTCNGGFYPGTEQFIFRANVTLVPCANWNMNWNLCCRNNAVSNLANPGGQRLYLQSTLNSVAAPGNTSLQFNALPTPYLCANQLSIYSNAAADPDGDSLYYALTNPLTTPGPPGVPIAYNFGFSALQPISSVAGVNFDPFTGEMCFIPSVGGEKDVVSVTITEFRNGVLIGSVIRDIQVVIVAGCNNQSPTTTATPSCAIASVLHPTYFGPSMTQLDSNSIIMCPNDSVCFDVNFYDNGIDNMYITSSIAVAIPTATFTITNDSTQNPVATICWMPTPLDSGFHSFSLTATDDACPIVGVQTFTFDITVYDQPYAGPDITICENEPAQLTATGGAGYTWFDPVTNIPVPAPTAEFSCNPCFNPIATPLVTTSYYVFSSLGAFCQNTDTLTITVIPSYFLTSGQSDTNICVGDTVNFLTTPSLTGTYTYNWTADFGSSLSTPNDSMTVGTFNAPGTEIISLMVSTASCALVDTFIVNIAPQPVINIITLDTLLNCADTVAINVGLGAAPVPNNYSFAWSFPTTLDDSTAQNPNAIPTQGITDYVVTVTDTLGGCFDMDTVEVRSCCITQSIGWDNSSCFDANDGSITVSANALNSDYIVEFHNNDPGFTLLQSSLGNPADTIINNLGPGSYIVLIFDTIGCSFSDMILITEPAPVTINNITASPDTFVCIDGSTTLQTVGFGIPPINLIWENGLVINGPRIVSPTANTTYTAYAQDFNGCVSDTQSITIQLYPPIIITDFYLTDTTICNGTTTTLVANATGGGAPLIYTWYDGNNIIIGATDTGAYVITPSYDGEIFTVIVSDSCSTPADTSTVLTDWATIMFPTYTISDSAGCDGDLSFNPVFENTTLGLSPLDSSSWDYGNGTTYSWPFATPFDYHYNDPGTYDVTLTITDEHGCIWDTIMAGLHVYVYHNPQADFLWNPNPTDYLNAQITFNNQSTNNFYNQWLFVTDAQYTSTDVNPVFQFPQDRPGSYDVTLITTTEHGCQDSITKVVVIDDVFLFYIPTAFTPDGDGLNDNFKVVGEGLDFNSFKMTVFNKWGELIFETSNPDNGWDGTYKGSVVASGVYIWKIDAKEAHSPIIHNKDGFITIVK